MILTAMRPALIELAILAMASATSWGQTPETSDWGYYGGDAFGQHYSSLAQINRGNVQRLTVAWTYRTGELGAGFERADSLAFEATPVLAFGHLYLETPTNIVIALDPASGRERWRYDPHIDRSKGYAEATARGVSVWQDPDASRHGACAQRIFTGTLDGRLLALDALGGTPCLDFGARGSVNLAGEAHAGHAGGYLLTSPPALFQDLVIVGSAFGAQRQDAGTEDVVRAYDARTGALRWAFAPPPEPDSPGAAHAYAVMSVDADRGLLYVPTGGSGRFASSLLALDAASGHLVWQQQLVHNDVWGAGLAAEPALVEIQLHGTPFSAVLQATKTGLLFAFDRVSGKPLSAVTERPVPAGLLPTEVLSPTQPFPDTPALMPLQALEPEEGWGVTFWDRAHCRALIARYRNEGIYTPPDPRGVLLRPSDLGGVSWGGVAFDARRQHVFAAVNQLPTIAVAPADGHGLKRTPFLSPWGLPCSAPPWGTLISIDLQRNRVAWQVPLGSTAGTGPWFAPTRDFGTPNMGGPIATAGDLVFVAAATDSDIRAFDLETGRNLWKYRLPAGGQATPMTYRAGKDQRQYLVIAAGGAGRLGTPRGDYVVAFALPTRQ